MGKFGHLLKEPEKRGMFAHLLKEPEPAPAAPSGLAETATFIEEREGFVPVEPLPGSPQPPTEVEQRAQIYGEITPPADQPWYLDAANFFTGGPGAGFEGAEKLVQPVIQPLANFALQFGRGGTLYIGDLAWFAAQKIFPDMPKETLAKRLETPFPGRELTGFAKTAGDIGEFVGGVMTAGALLKGLGLPAVKGKTLLKRIFKTAPPWATHGAIQELAEGIVEEKPLGEIAAETAKGAARGAAMAAAASTVAWGADKLWQSIAAKYPTFAAKVVKESASEAHRTASHIARHKRVLKWRAYFKKHGRLPDEAYAEAGVTAPEAVRPVPPGTPLSTAPSSPDMALVPVRDVKQMSELLKALMAYAKANAAPIAPDVTLPGSLKVLARDADAYRTALESAIVSPDRVATGQAPLPRPRLYPDDERVPPVVATYVTTQPSDAGLEITPRDLPQGVVMNEMISKIAEDVGGSVLIEPRRRDRLYVVAGDNIVAMFDRGPGGWTPDIVFDPERPWPALGDRTIGPRDELDEMLAERLADRYAMKAEGLEPGAAETPLAAETKALVPVETPASAIPKDAPTKKQLAYAHILSRERGLSQDDYRALATAITGKESAALMTRDELSRFIDAMDGAPEPHYDELGTPVQPPLPPDPDAIALPGEVPPQPPKYKTPALLIPSFTPPEVYAVTLGLGPLVRPIEQAKRSYDIELRGMIRQVETWGRDWQKLDTFERLGARIVGKLKKKPTPAFERLADLLDTFEDPPDFLSDAEKEIFNRFRNLTRILLSRMNKVRARLDMDLIKDRKAYIRYVIDHTSETVANGAFEEPKNLSPWVRRHIAKKIFNPMEKARLSKELGEIFIKDPVYAFKAMLATGLKEIHLDEPLYYLTEHLKMYGEDIPTETHQWLNDYINLNIKGQMTSADRRANAMVTETFVGDALNLILKPFGRSITSRPVTNMMRFVGQRQSEAVLGPRPKLLIRNLFQTVQNLAFSGIGPTVKGFGPAPDWMKEMLERSQFLQVYEQEFMETSQLSGLSKAQEVYHAGYRWTAIDNAKRAKRTGIYNATELVLDERYAEHGWRSPRRTGNEPKGFFYPEEQALIDRESDWIAAAAQYQYDALGMPQLYRGKVAGGLFRLFSWPMNHFFRFHREALHRLIQGKPSWSDGSVTLPWSRRLGLLRYLVIGGIVLNTLGYARSFLYGVPPSELPPTAQVLQHTTLSILHWSQGNEKQAAYHKRRLGRALMTFIPAYYLSRDIKAVIDSTKEPWELFFYPPPFTKEKVKKRSGE